MNSSGLEKKLRANTTNSDRRFEGHNTGIHWKNNLLLESKGSWAFMVTWGQICLYPVIPILSDLGFHYIKIATQHLGNLSKTLNMIHVRIAKDSYSQPSWSTISSHHTFFPSITLRHNLDLEGIDCESECYNMIFISCRTIRFPTSRVPLSHWIKTNDPLSRHLVPCRQKINEVHLPNLNPGDGIENPD